MIDRFHSRWAFTRRLTLDLLRSLDDSDLEFTPTGQMGPVWKQFRHMGRVQENYLQALETGRIDFGFGGASYDGGASKQRLIQYFERLDSDLKLKLQSAPSLREHIDWFGARVDIADHLGRMMDHEVLHQGMLVVYMRLLGRQFPRSWSAWGL